MKFGVWWKRTRGQKLGFYWIVILEVILKDISLRILIELS